MSTTTATHPVSPEDLMALLDGELSADRAQFVSAHTESCANCQQAYTSLLNTSHSLAAWAVQPTNSYLGEIASDVKRKAVGSTWLASLKTAPRSRAIGWAIGLATSFLLLLAIATPNLLRSKFAANQASSVGSLRAINTAISEYREQYGHNPSSLRDLGPSRTGQASQNGADLIDPVLASGTKSGYQFSYQPRPGLGYRVDALPLDDGYGQKRFSTDQTGVLNADGTPLDSPVSPFIAHLPESTRARNERALSETGSVAEPGIAADGNGLLQDKDDHVQNSFSLNGQPVADQQARVFSNPMIARSVSLAILVKDFDVSRKSLDSILVRYNGYAASLTINTPQGASRSVTASLRIPAPQLPAALAELRSLGHVENESQNGEEVTQQHADLVARLKNSRETEQRLQAILTQRSGKISDVLQVEQEIARVRGEIEQMEAEQKNLEHRVDFAAVDLSLSEEYKAKLDSAVPSLSTRFHNALINGYRNVADTIVGLLLWIAEYTPILLFWAVLLLVPAWLAWRRFRQVATAS